ncbi:MAG: hypothetical protein PCFJNLEI_02505 [Verrucomicrobiae bacterium]|nr:hypothetical protein [Verrucomicrobiae bacterium]
MGAAPEPKLTYRGKFVVRTLGGIFLIGCLLMLGLGETILKEHLQGPLFLLFWTWCFLFALLAGLTAVLDLICVRHAGKKNRRELFQRQFLGKP